MPSIDLTAGYLPIYGEPADGITIPVTVPSGFETGTWTAVVYADTRKTAALATFTVVVVGQVVTVSLTTLQTSALVTAGMSRFAGHWELDRSVVGESRTWLKGPFVLDAAHQVVPGGTQAVTLGVVANAVTVTAAAGSATTADLIAALHGPGAPGLVGTELRTARAAWAGRGSTPFTVLFVGDSNDVGYYASSDANRRVKIFARMLEIANGQLAAPGYQTRNTSTNYLNTWTSSGTVVDVSSGFGYGAVAVTPPGYIEATQTCDRFWVRYTMGTLVGGFNVTIDGGAPIAVPFTAGTITGGFTWDSGPLTRASHTVRLTATDGFGFGSRFEGIVWFDGNGNTSGAQGALSAANSLTGAGVRVFGAGRLGATAGTVAVPSGTTWWTDGLDKINPDLVVLDFITNEIATGVLPATFRTNLVTIMDRVTTVMTAAARPTPSYVIRIPHGTGASASAITPYIDAAKTAAADRGAAVYNELELFGYVGTPAADTVAVTSPTDGSTRVHLSDRGHRLSGERFAGWFLP